MVGTDIFEVTPLGATFGARVTGAKLVDLDDAGVAALYRAWLDYSLLIFPGQHLDDAQQIAFAGRFGALEFELSRLGNVDVEGRVRPPDDEVVRGLDGNRFWHCDSTFKPLQAQGSGVHGSSRAR
jgi:alpha-ketoglutarate-dependent taurine dioxygenase